MKNVLKLIVALVFIHVLTSAQTSVQTTTPTSTQTAPSVVPITNEPSHHMVLDNEYVRVFYVEVPPHAETQYHQHDHDYIYVTLGDASVDSVRVGEKPAHLDLKDGDTKFTKGSFAHKAVNQGDKPFRNITIEVKQNTVDMDLSDGLLKIKDHMMMTCINNSCSGQFLKSMFYSCSLFTGHDSWTMQEEDSILVIPLGTSIIEKAAFGGEKLMNVPTVTNGSVYWITASETRRKVRSVKGFGFVACNFNNEK